MVLLIRSCNQLNDEWEFVNDVLKCNDSFAEDARSVICNLITDDKILTIRAELGLIEDIGVPMAKLCYDQEGDDFISPTTYDQWNSAVNNVIDICDPMKNMTLHLNSAIHSAASIDLQPMTSPASSQNTSISSLFLFHHQRNK